MIRILKKLGLVLSKEQKTKIVILVMYMLIGAVLETMSVSLVVPLITALMQEGFMESNPLIGSVCEWLNISETREFVLIIIIALIVLFLLKDAFLFFQYNVQTRFICNSRVETQKKLMKIYMNRPYEFFLESDLQKSVPL